MAIAKVFKPFWSEQIALNRENKSFAMFLTLSENKDNNAKSDIKNSNKKKV